MIPVAGQGGAPVVGALAWNRHHTLKQISGPFQRKNPVLSGRGFAENLAPRLSTGAIESLLRREPGNRDAG
jgi:hypothetical protein